MVNSILLLKYVWNIYNAKNSREYLYITYPYTLHKQQLDLASGLPQRWHFMYNTVQGFSSSHPFPISHLLTGLHQSTFLTCVELFLLRGHQDNNYTATSEPKKSKQCTETLIFQLHREATPKLQAPISHSFCNLDSQLHHSACYSPLNFKYTTLNYPTHIILNIILTIYRLQSQKFLCFSPVTLLVLWCIIKSCFSCNTF